MKTPPPTPSYAQLLDRDPSRVSRLLGRLTEIDDRNYLHWEQLRHRTPPTGLTAEDWWCALAIKRLGNAIVLPDLRATNGSPLHFSRHARIDMGLADADRRLAGTLSAPEPTLNADTRDRFLVSSLMEEAIHSSLFEGAVSTREMAKEMLRSNREPLTVDERMIVNNFRAMERIRTLRSESMSLDLLLELHRIVTEGTLDEPAATGRIQQPDEPRVAVLSKLLHRAVHQPPPAESLPERMQRMIAFANGPDDADGEYVHPVVRSILLHFQLAYDHPFADGNGRTARALFYWSMLRRGYWLTEFVSISRLLYRNRSPYERAFQWVESDHQDATYFVLQQLDALREATDQLYNYVQLKSRQNAELSRLISTNHEFNHRQTALLHHAMRHAGTRYTHESHARSHGVSLMTARADLQALVGDGLLTMRREGKKLVYRAALDLDSKMRPKAE